MKNIHFQPVLRNRITIPLLERHLALLFLLSMVFFGRCDLNFFDCIDGDQNVITVERSLNSFEEICSQGQFDLYVKQGDGTDLIIEAEENLIPYISTRVKHGRLVIDNADNRCLRPNLPMKVYITVPTLEILELEGSGSITCDTFHIDDLTVNLLGSGVINIAAETSFLEVNLAGSGDIFLRGFADHTDLTISGSGTIHAYDLEQNNCIVNISGSGNMYVFVNELLDVHITGSGDVNYRGTPDVRTRITGSGSVINDN